jgi:hypothetical protein
MCGHGPTIGADAVTGVPDPGVPVLAGGDPEPLVAVELGGAVEPGCVAAPGGALAVAGG